MNEVTADYGINPPLNIQMKLHVTYDKTREVHIVNKTRG